MVRQFLRERWVVPVEDAVVRNAVDSEFDAWVTAGGSQQGVREGTSPLPDGWVEVAREPVGRDLLLLLRRETGGWMAWLTDIKDSVWAFPFSSQTFAGLYEGTRDLHIGVGLRAIIGRFYDPADPVEAAEMTLMALGGDPARFPAALTLSGTGT